MLLNDNDFELIIRPEIYWNCYFGTSIPTYEKCFMIFQWINRHRAIAHYLMK